MNFKSGLQNTVCIKNVCNLSSISEEVSEKV